jgi:FkbM family methyltransferase
MKDLPVLEIKEEQYYLSNLTFNDDEVYIDCGAYDGDTIDRFIEHCPQYKHIVGFEPLTNDFNKLYEKHGNNPKIRLYNAGAYDKDGEVSFSLKTPNSPQITANDGQKDFKIQVKCVDNLGLDRITFIKMDIEGAELEALKGAKNTIIKDKPKLAICIYHKIEDLIDIPEYILSLVPEYDLYIRQYQSAYETVLYAIPNT